jgi:hypothetical protein
LVEWKFELTGSELGCTWETGAVSVRFAKGFVLLPLKRDVFFAVEAC